MNENSFSENKKPSENKSAVGKNNATEKLVVALLIPSLCYGGAERQVVEVARNLDRSRFETHIILLEDYMPILPEDDELRRFVHVIEKHGKFDVSVVWRLAALFKKLNVQVVHSFLFFSEIATRLAATMVGIRPRIGSERNTQYKMAKFRYVFLQATIGLADLIVANSTAGAKFHSNLYKLPASRYRVVHNGVDIARFRVRDRDECKKNLGLDETALIIGMFASFKKQKNHIELFRAMQPVVKKFPQVRLLLVGDTLLNDFGDTVEYKAEVKRVQHECGLDDTVIVLGNRTDVELIYSACDFTVLPSLHEGTPNVVLESMACGVAALVTDVSDNAMLVTDGQDGLVVAANDTNALQQKLEMLCGDAVLRALLGRGARVTAESRLSTQVMSENMARVYQNAFDEFGRR